MASLLSNHLEQISLCATSIAELPFQGPKRFTNALLSAHDITSLIRDTEQHERALFHLAPPPLPQRSLGGDGPGAVNAHISSLNPTTGNRRATVYGSRQPKNKAVAAVLGGDLYQKTRRADAGARVKGEVDVELLLAGAEKLAAVYPIPGATERIAQLRRRHHQLSANVAHYEAHVAQQARELSAMNDPSSQTYDVDDDLDMDLGEDEDGAGGFANEDTTHRLTITKEDLEREEMEVKELERKKKGLEDRVTGMERDLGGLMR